MCVCTYVWGNGGGGPCGGGGFWGGGGGAYMGGGVCAATILDGRGMIAAARGICE